MVVKSCCSSAECIWPDKVRSTYRFIVKEEMVENGLVRVLAQLRGFCGDNGDDSLTCQLQPHHTGDDHVCQEVQGDALTCN